MYLLTKPGGHKSYGNGDVNSFIESYMYLSKKAELTASVHHTDRFSKIKNTEFEVLEKPRQEKKRQFIAKR